MKKYYMLSNQVKLSIADDVQTRIVFNEMIKNAFGRSYWLIKIFQ